MREARPILYAFLISLFLPTCSAPEKEGTENEGVSGERIYRQKCSSCHGSDGKKGVSGATDLSKSGMKMKERVRTIEEGRGAMIPFKNVLEKNEIKAVAEYLDELRADKE